MYASGVLPFCVVQGHIYYLLGRETKTKDYGDFGGLAEDVDNNNVYETAAREFHEESYGMIVDKHYVSSQLPICKCVKNDRSAKWTEYTTFLLEIPYDNQKIINMFPRVFEFIRKNTHLQCEKDRLVWVRVNDLVENRFNFSLRPMFQQTVNSHPEILYNPFIAAESLQKIA